MINLYVDDIEKLWCNDFESFLDHDSKLLIDWCILEHVLHEIQLEMMNDLVKLSFQSVIELFSFVSAIRMRITEKIILKIIPRSLGTNL